MSDMRNARLAESATSRIAALLLLVAAGCWRSSSIESASEQPASLGAPPASSLAPLPAERADGPAVAGGAPVVERTQLPPPDDEALHALARQLVSGEVPAILNTDSLRVRIAAALASTQESRDKLIRERDAARLEIYKDKLATGAYERIKAEEADIWKKDDPSDALFTTSTKDGSIVRIVVRRNDSSRYAEALRGIEEIDTGRIDALVAVLRNVLSESK